MFSRIGLSTAIAVSLSCVVVLSGCGGGGNDEPAERTVSSLRLIGQQVLPRRIEFNGTVVGGLSGIDYDVLNQRYVLISDDRTVGAGRKLTHL